MGEDMNGWMAGNIARKEKGSCLGDRKTQTDAKVET